MPVNSARPLFERSDDERLIAVTSGPEMPRYGVEPPIRSPRRARLRQAALLMLMALAGSLIFVLPEPDQDGYALSSEQETTIRIGPTDAATGVQRVGGAEGDEGDELALATGNGRSADLAGGVGDPSADLDSIPGAPSDDGDHRLAAGIAEMAAFAMAPSAPEVTETTESPTTTTPAEETAVETTTTTEAATTTSAPAATAPDETTVDAEPAGSAADGQSTGEGDGAPDGGETAGADGSTPSGGDGADSGDSTTTTEPEPPADTQPPDTQPPDTQPAPEPDPVDPGWVDAGNGVLVPQVLIAIRYCESRDNYTAANPSSTARGAYQFLTGSWDYYGHKARYGVNQAHLATPAQQDEAALMTWERDGTRPWNASKSCWSQRI